MAITSCSTDKVKAQLISEYDIKPVARLMLLPGQSIEGCCGPITTIYTVFSAVKTVDEKTIKESFVVGVSCAKSFSIMLNLPLPKVFNPLAQRGSKSTSKSSSNAEPSISFQDKLTPLNSDLYKAIHVLIASWNASVSGLLLDSLIYLQNSPDRDTQEWALKAFNRIVGKDRQNRKLVDMLTDIHFKDNNIPMHPFDELHKSIIKIGETSNIKRGR